jgi:acyl dehydratase
MSTLERWPGPRRFAVGDAARRTVVIEPELIDAFAAVSGDRGVLHLDAGFARAHGLTTRVAHGMLLGALASSLIGTELPGTGWILHEMRVTFHHPCYAGDRVTLEATVAELHETTSTLTGRVEAHNDAGQLLMKARFRSGLLTAS